jgi:peptide/nickel transport system permease protein
MTAYIIRRLLITVVLLAITTLVTFAIFFWLPRLAGQTPFDLASQYVGKQPTRTQIIATEKRLGLDQPLLLQYAHFVKNLVAGGYYGEGSARVHCPPPCYGYSFKNDQAVWPLLMQHLPVTASLAVGASVLWLIGGVAVGVVSAIRKGTLIDRIGMGIALGGVSLPIFFTGLVALALFSYKWPLFPNIEYVPLTQNPLEWAKNLVLPWIALAFLYAALYARLTRAGMLEVMGEDYIRTARAKGLPERVVIFKHGLRSTLTPVLTIFGMDLGLLIGGAVLTEKTFSLQGLGNFAITAVFNDDLPEILGFTLLTAFFVIIANVIVDILYAALDPRVRY